MVKLGIDWGGTKVEGVLLTREEGKELKRVRIASPKGDYEETLVAIANFIGEFVEEYDDWTVGIGMPGSLAPKTGLVQVSNLEKVEGRPVKTDLERLLGYEVRIENDANCLALSEATDGAGADYGTVFAVILGTGVGGGIVVNKRLVVGPNKITGEWGQNPIRGPRNEYELSVKRHCGTVGTVEALASGPALKNYYTHISGREESTHKIIELYRAGEEVAKQCLDTYFERLARSLSTVINILDPDVIVVGGGISEVDEIYTELPKKLPTYVASDDFVTPIVKAKYGATSGVRGAAHLWS